MSNLSKYIIRISAAICTFFVTGFISLLILKVSFGNPYDPKVADTAGYILLLIVLLCVLYVDTFVDQKLNENH